MSGLGASPVFPVIPRSIGHGWGHGSRNQLSRLLYVTAVPHPPRSKVADAVASAYALTISATGEVTSTIIRRTDGA